MKEGRQNENENKKNSIMKKKITKINKISKKCDVLIFPFFLKNYQAIVVIKLLSLILSFMHNHYE